jgi:hypothetical protein
MVFFNSSNGTTITEALKIQHISIFGICEDVLHFAQHYYNLTKANYHGQLPLNTDIHMLHTVAQYGGRKGH